MAMDELSDVFTEPPAPRHIHIVVRPTGECLNLWLAVSIAHDLRPVGNMLEIHCWIIGDDPNHIFPIDIATPMAVDAFKEVIKEKKQRFWSVEAESLVLYTVSTLTSLRSRSPSCLPQVAIDKHKSIAGLKPGDGIDDVGGIDGVLRVIAAE